MSAMPRAVVIGLDGAAWHLLGPLLDAGLMPRLQALRSGGACGTLLSTVPTYTPPAWTSAATGVNPGRHGIYGFHSGNAQSERQELMHSGKVAAPTVWEMANAQGARAGIFNLPLTYPPQALDGWMVSGMMTPSYGHHLRGFVYPAELEAKVLQWAPGYVVEIKTSWDLDWRDEALGQRALASIQQRGAVLQGLLESDPPDIVFGVLEAPDRLQHAYYGYLDPGAPAADGEVAGAVRPALERCFAALDDVVGLLADYAGADGGVILCSDHGFTAWEMSVHTNALLESWGYLRLRPGARAMQTGLARRMVPLAKRLLPARVAREAKGRTFAAVDWSRTQAFASPIPLQGIFINARGRERLGTVPSREIGALKDAIARRFEDLRAPDGGAVTDRVWRSEEVFSGDALEGAPDLMPVLRGHRFELDDEIFHRSAFTDTSELPRGVHHPDGIVGVYGPGVAAGAAISGSVMDVTPTLLYLAGLAVPEGLDGRVLVGAFQPGHLDAHPVRTTAAAGSRPRDEQSPYSEDEEAVIEESLKGLGYL
jgi:predicted AlkP superfamily phosphohydrolase/phosphomutase